MPSLVLNWWITGFVMFIVTSPKLLGMVLAPVIAKPFYFLCSFCFVWLDVSSHSNLSVDNPS
jgi:hypothetical protein